MGKRSTASGDKIVQIDESQIHSHLDRVVRGTVSRLNQKVYKRIEAWRNAPIEGKHTYVYLDGLVLKRTWAGEVRHVSVLVAVGVDQDGFRTILGICEGANSLRHTGAGSGPTIRSSESCERSGDGRRLSVHSLTGSPR